MDGLLERLAVPRLHGTANAGRVADDIRQHLERAGCEVEMQPFTFSAWPGLHGALVLGTLLFATLGGAALFLATGHVGPAVISLATPAIATLALVLWSDRLVLDLPAGRRTGTNMLAAPPGTRARYLIVAHRDSKSQPVPLAGRVGGVVAAVVAWLALLALSARGGGPPGVIVAIGLAGALGAATLGCCRTGNRSDGALDNASGLLCLLRMAELGRQVPTGDVAYLVTDAEELGLAGARAAAESFPDVEWVINLDGLDDHGPIVLVDGPSLLPAAPNRLTNAIDQAAARKGETIRHRGLPPGLLLDHLPFSRAGHSALTVMRGTLRSMSRVHRPHDSTARLTGQGSTIVASILHDALDLARRVAPHTASG